MDKKLKEKADKKVKEGWIRAWMMIECMAITPEAAKSALETHTKKMNNEERMLIYKQEFKKIQELEKPLRGKDIEKAYSLVVEIELVSETFERLVALVMNYAPSALEIIEPDNLKLDAGEAQGILNSVSDMVHNFAAAGIGGVVVQS